MIGGGRLQTEHSSHTLISADQDSVNVILPGAFGHLVLDQVSGQVRVAIVRSLPGQLDVSSVLLKNLQVKWSLRHLLDDQIDAGVITAECISGHTGEQGRVCPLSPLDADSAEDAISDNLLPDSVPGVHQGVQPLVVHVPKDPDGLLTLGFT